MMASWQMPKVVKNISDTFCDLRRMSTAKRCGCGSTLRCLQVNAVPLRRTMWWMSMIATTPIIHLFVRRVSFMFLYSPLSLCLLVLSAVLHGQIHKITCVCISDEFIAFLEADFWLHFNKK